jgi:hypothetical protein
MTKTAFVDAYRRYRYDIVEAQWYRAREREVVRRVQETIDKALAAKTVTENDL